MEAYDPLLAEADAKEIEKLIAKINVPALAARASELRNGIPCHIAPLCFDDLESSRWSVMGGMNYHIELKFNDGICWLARVRRFNATSPPPMVRDYIIKSEVATLRFLETTKVPAPKVFDFVLEGNDNPVGVGYILMEKMAGKMLLWSTASPKECEKVVSQLSKVYLELQAHPFELMGSLDLPGTLSIGGFARESLTDINCSELQLLDHCRSAKDYYAEVVRLNLKLIVYGESYSDRAVDAYLVHKFLWETVPIVFASPLDDGPFYLKHADDKGDHILVDDEFNITGIIDWEWAYTTSKPSAFISPTFSHPLFNILQGR
ncbi:MAG: hypothetical protein M1819_002069 [Sarea resinae]|nr:MAG: hypothetical protein M1819_002069 [Sarea resinae]